MSTPKAVEFKDVWPKKVGTPTPEPKKVTEEGAEPKHRWERGKLVLHQHACPQCKKDWFCDLLECSSQGVTPKVCDECQGKPRTLADIKNELWLGTNELLSQFGASITDQMELTAEQQEVMGDYLQGTIEKRDRLASCIKAIEEEAERIREREKQLAERRHELEKVASLFRSSILIGLQNWKRPDGSCTAITRVDGLESSFRVQKNPAKVEITDESAIPGQFITYKPQIELRTIKDALDRGEEVPGARISDTTYRLVIK